MTSTTYLERLIETPRYGGLCANRMGDVVVSVSSLTADGSEYRGQLFSLAQTAASQRCFPLTAPDSKANVLALAESGDIYLMLGKDLDGEYPDSARGIYRLGGRGEPELIFTFPDGVEELEVREREGGTRLIFSARAVGKGATEAAEILDERSKKKVSAILHESFPTRYWDHDHGIGEQALYVKDGDAEPRRIDLPEGRFNSFTVDATGDRALVGVCHLIRGVHQRYSTFLVDLNGTAEPQPVAVADERLSFFPGPFNPAGTHAVITREHGWLKDQSLQLELCTYEFATGELTRQFADVDSWFNEACWVDDKTLAMVADWRGASAVFRATLGGESTQLPDNHNFYSHLAMSSGNLVALSNSVANSSFPVTIEVASGTVTPFDDIPVEPIRAPGTLEKIRTTASDGVEITSWLALPEGGSATPRPLVIFAHGGPWGSWNSWTYRWNPWVLTEAGYAVLMPDPAISTGYGQAMIERGGHSVGDEPYTDILAVIDDVAQRADIDGERAAFMGGSYGGYMTNWVAGQQGTRFKCFITHASIWNQEHMYTTTDNGVWHEWMWESEDNVRNTYSPHQFAENIQAPMLVIHGDKDYRVPISQGQMLWFDLQRNSPELGHKFLYFPDEGHWIMKPGNSRIWYQTVLAFLNQHVLEEEFNRPQLLG